MNYVLGVLLLLSLSPIQSFAAAQFPAKARLFVGVTTVDPEDVNEEMTAQGLKEFENVSKLGVEITYAAAKFFDVGLNYTHRQMDRDELNSTPSTDWNASLKQDSVSMVGRLPFLKSKFVRMDVFAAVGGTNTTLTVKTATQDGELSRKESNDWFASVMTTYGASIAVGYKKFYLVLEGGIEANKVGSLKRSGNLNSNVETIDLSGSYASIGLLFDGITASTK